MYVNFLKCTLNFLREPSFRIKSLTIVPFSRQRGTVFGPKQMLNLELLSVTI